MGLIVLLRPGSFRLYRRPRIWLPTGTTVLLASSTLSDDFAPRLLLVFFLYIRRLF